MIGLYLAAAVPGTETVVEPSWNVAPTQPVTAVIEEDDDRHVDRFRWGLVSFWAKTSKPGPACSTPDPKQRHRTTRSVGC